MRLIKKIKEWDSIANAEYDDYTFLDHSRVKEAILKMGQIEDLEDIFGIELKNLFNYKEDPFCMLEIEAEEYENGEREVYFDGDSFYGRYKKEDWLDLIKRMIKAYIEVWGNKVVK